MADEVKRVEGPDRSIDGWLELEAGYFLGDCFVAMYEPDALEVSYGESTVAADDSGRSFLPKHTACMPLPVLRALLLSQGLHIVGEAEMLILRLMAEVDPRRLHGMHDGISNLSGACDAELARRAAKGE